MSRTLAASVIALTVGVGGVTAAGQLGGVVDATKQVGEATKEGAKTAGQATKEAVKTTGETTKKGAQKAKETVTGKARATCVDGTSHTAKTQKAANAACGKHGGIAK
jgi:hypothetical protein